MGKILDAANSDDAEDEDDPRGDYVASTVGTLVDLYGIRTFEDLLLEGFTEDEYKKHYTLVTNSRLH